MNCAPGTFTNSLREAAIAKAYLRPEMVVADVGAGTGFMAAGLAPLVKQVYALDGSPAMLEVARRNLAGFSNVVFRVSDGSCPVAGRCQRRRSLCQHVPPSLRRSRRRHP